jgi:hypothetical protein
MWDGDSSPEQVSPARANFQGGAELGLMEYGIVTPPRSKCLLPVPIFKEALAAAAGATRIITESFILL